MNTHPIKKTNLPEKFWKLSELEQNILDELNALLSETTAIDLNEVSFLKNLDFYQLFRLSFHSEKISDFCRSQNFLMISGKKNILFLLMTLKKRDTRQKKQNPYQAKR
jgi:hypothetical protein